MTTRTFGTVLICSFSGILAGQSPESQVGFEVAAIKSVAPAADGLPHRRGGPGTSDPDRFSYSNVTLDVLIRVAYGDRRPFQVAGPSWLTSNRYDVTAKVPTAATQEQFNRMLLNLLIERFHLAVHHETLRFYGMRIDPGEEWTQAEGISAGASRGYGKGGALQARSDQAACAP